MDCDLEIAYWQERIDYYEKIVALMRSEVVRLQAQRIRERLANGK